MDINSPQPTFDMMSPQQMHPWQTRLMQLSQGIGTSQETGAMHPGLVQAIHALGSAPAQGNTGLQGTPPWAPAQQSQQAQAPDPFVQMLQKLIGGLGKTS